MEYGIQLYSVRDTMSEDMRGTLEKIAALGYRSVEFAGFFGRSTKEITSMLTDNNLRISGTHTGMQELKDDFDQTLAFHKEIGNDTIIIPFEDLSDQGKIDRFLEDAEKMRKRLEEHGIRLGYHNHYMEFIPNEDGSLIYEQLVEKSDLALELDTYWAYVAGQDPIALMEELKNRLIFIHIKDGLVSKEGKPLGMGTAPVDRVYEKAALLGIQMVVESETLTPDGLTEASICIEYLKKLENRN